MARDPMLGSYATVELDQKLSARGHCDSGRSCRVGLSWEMRTQTLCISLLAAALR